MSGRVGNTIILVEEIPQRCELCGAIAECRPYGPNGEEICFDCGMKNEATTKRMMGKVLFGERKRQG